MRNKFACFYDVKNDDEIKAIWEDDNTLFIFDTNVLLSLYAFKSESRDDFFKVLSKIESRIWIPFHVCLEFQLNRITVIKNRRNSFSKLKKGIGGLHDILKLDKKPFTTLQTEFSLQKKYPEVHQSLDKLQKDLDAGVKKLNEELKLSIQNLEQSVNKIDTEKLFVNSDDFIRNKIDHYFNDDRVGNNNFKTQSELDEFNKYGAERYENNIPPGYEDAKLKGEEEFFFDGLRYKRKFGDLIIFKQIIDYAKDKKQKNIIFISEDVKEDWRQIEDFGGEKILGARIELKREIFNEAGVENFLIFNIEDFIQKTKEHLNVNINKDTIKNIKSSLANAAEVLKNEKNKKIEAYQINFNPKIREYENEDCKFEWDEKLGRYNSLKCNDGFESNKSEKNKTLKDIIDMQLRNTITNFSNKKNEDFEKNIISKDERDNDGNIENKAMYLIGKLSAYIGLNNSNEVKYRFEKLRTELHEAMAKYDKDPKWENYFQLDLECRRVSYYLETWDV
ncbi:PIN-like domain-containing protein [Providencia rettgeri]|uniref:PIN-like domain-containing protein n=1 Tax=Providencia rettgeri TaxID=587 RepID=UPI00300FF276